MSPFALRTNIFSRNERRLWREKKNRVSMSRSGSCGSQFRLKGPTGEVQAGGSRFYVIAKVTRRGEPQEPEGPAEPREHQERPGRPCCHNPCHDHRRNPSSHSSNPSSRYRRNGDRCNDSCVRHNAGRCKSPCRCMRYDVHRHNGDRCSDHDVHHRNGGRGTSHRSCRDHRRRSRCCFRPSWRSQRSRRKSRFQAQQSCSFSNPPKRLTGTVSENSIAVRLQASLRDDGSSEVRPIHPASFRSKHPDEIPVANLCGLRRM